MRKEINENSLKDLGFELSELNKHIYSIQAYGKHFNVIKHLNPENISDEYKHLNHLDFIVDFPSYYDEVRFYDFKYMDEIENLILALERKL